VNKLVSVSIIDGLGWMVCLREVQAGKETNLLTASHILQLPIAAGML
jgi:hypothetical protein